MEIIWDHVRLKLCGVYCPLTTNSFIDSKFCELSQFDFENRIKDPKYI